MAEACSLLEIDVVFRKRLEGDRSCHDRNATRTAESRREWDVPPLLQQDSSSFR
jgi:hypothetical protein